MMDADHHGKRAEHVGCPYLRRPTEASRGWIRQDPSGKGLRTMLENRVILHLGTHAWTFAGVSLVVGLALVVTAAVLFTILLRQRGKTRVLVGAEASDIAFNVGRIGQAGAIQGPAIGAEVRLKFTIGDLRRAHQAGDRLFFWGAPAMFMAWVLGFGALLLALVVRLQDFVFLVGYVVVVPMALMGAFMPWAALHTDLE